MKRLTVKQEEVLDKIRAFIDGIEDESQERLVAEKDYILLKRDMEKLNEPRFRVRVGKKR